MYEVRTGELAGVLPIGANLRRTITHSHRLKGDNVVLREVIGEALAGLLELARELERPGRLSRLRVEDGQIVPLRGAGEVPVDDLGREPPVADALLLQLMAPGGELVGDQLLVRLPRLHLHAPLH